MDQEMKDYLDRKFLGMGTRDDIEKLRQEAKVNFRQMKEEIKGQFLEWRQKMEADLEPLKKENRAGIDSVREEIKEELKGMRSESQSAIDQCTQALISSLERVREEGRALLSRSGQETKADLDHLKERLKSLNQVAEEMVLLKEKMGEGFREVKDELGAMIKFSYADLEKRIHTLEARIKALEKMVFP